VSAPATLGARPAEVPDVDTASTGRPAHRRARLAPRTGRRAVRAAATVVLVAATVLLVYPLVWLLSASLKPRGDVFDDRLLPRELTFENAPHDSPRTASVRLHPCRRAPPAAAPPPSRPRRATATGASARARARRTPATRVRACATGTDTRPGRSPTEACARPVPLSDIRHSSPMCAARPRATRRRVVVHRRPGDVEERRALRRLVPREALLLAGEADDVVKPTRLDKRVTPHHGGARHQAEHAGARRRGGVAGERRPGELLAERVESLGGTDEDATATSPTSEGRRQRVDRGVQRAGCPPRVVVGERLVRRRRTPSVRAATPRFRPISTTSTWEWVRRTASAVPSVEPLSTGITGAR